MTLQLLKLASRLTHAVALATILHTAPALAVQAAPNADALEAKAREASIDRFKNFMQDKNVQTAAKDPSGKKIQGIVKKAPNPDDKNPFESDLTYHDRSFTKVNLVKDDSKPNDPNATKIEEEKAFKSPHGKLSAAGGSSTLERKSEEVDKRFEEADKKSQKQPEEGVTYDGMFKETVKEITEKDIQTGKAKDPNKPAAPIGAGLANDPTGSKNKEDEYITVSKKEIREEALKDFQDVGKNAGQTVIDAAKDPDEKNNKDALANGVLLRAGAAENLMAMFRSTKANQTQRQVNKAIAPLQGSGDRVEMDEETATCTAWEAKARAQIAKAPPEKREQMEKDLKGMLSQCNQISSLPFTTVNPRYVRDEKEKEFKYSEEGAKTEDGIERDSRIQLEIMAKGGKSVTEVESNWKYAAEDDEVKLNRYQTDGSSKEVKTTVKKEIESYNNQLKAAKEGYDEVAKRLQNFTPPDPTQYAIQPGEKSVMEISQAPAAAMEEYGVQGRGSLTEALPQSYEQMQNSGQ